MTFVADDTVLFVGILTGSTSENCGNYQETSGDVQRPGRSLDDCQILAHRFGQWNGFFWLLNLRVTPSHRLEIMAHQHGL
jgi:hypothetical protein